MKALFSEGHPFECNIAEISFKMNGPQRTACLAKGCINNQSIDNTQAVGKLNGYIPGNVTCQTTQTD